MSYVILYVHNYIIIRINNNVLVRRAVKRTVIGMNIYDALIRVVTSAKLTKSLLKFVPPRKCLNRNRMYSIEVVYTLWL